MSDGFKVGDVVAYTNPAMKSRSGAHHLVGTLGIVEEIDEDASCTIKVKFFASQETAEALDRSLNIETGWSRPFLYLWVRPTSIQKMEGEDDWL